MQILESSIERKVCKWAEDERGIRNIKVKADGKRGYPDRLFFIPGGKPLFIEFKKPGEVAGPLQKYIHRILRKLGYEVKVCDSEEKAKKEITRVLKISRKLLDPRQRPNKSG